MGLRDRLAANYYIPLVAGIESAARTGTLAPPEVYAPGIIGSGIGTGDGGNLTPDDANIAAPSITAPTCASTGVSINASATSSAFSSTTEGETHAKSRWVLEYRGSGTADELPSPFVIYDTGPVADALALKSLSGLIGHNTRYAIKVRYKGSGGGWSPWSDYCTFTTGDCPPTTGGPQTLDEPHTITYPDTLTTDTSDLSPPAAVASWWDVKAYLVDGSYWDDQGFIEGNAGRVEPTPAGSGVTYYHGADALLHAGSATTQGVGGTIHVSSTNTATGGHSFVGTIRWTGTTKDPDQCIPLPPVPSDQETPPPIFVPPPSQPPTAPPLPGVPPSQGKYARIAIDLQQSIVIIRDNGGTQTHKTLAEIVQAGGWDMAQPFCQFRLVFVNTGNAPGTVNYAANGDSTNLKFLSLVGNEGLETPWNNPSYFGSPITFPRTIGSAPFYPGVDIWNLRLDPEGTETHTVTLDLGDGTDPLQLKLGFAPTDPFLIGGGGA